MKGFDHFNFLSPIYDLVFGRGQDLRIVDLADVNENHRLLDVGGGTGRVSVLFRKIVNSPVVADSSLKMLRKAQEKGLQSVNSHSEYLPYPNGSFDRVILVDAFHHVKEQQKTLNEMFRILKNGGKMIIEEPDIRNFLVKLVAIGEKILLMRSHFLAPEKIAAMCRYDGESNQKIYIEKGIARIVVIKIGKEVKGTYGSNSSQ